jgi:ATP-dependent Clp protease ATP-binding subunit ClpA
MQLMPATARRFGVRALQKYVEDELSEALIQGEIDDESLIEIFLDKEKLAFRSITNGKIKKQKIS